MNRFEFMACGYMLYGNEWKTDFARSLGWSVVSKNVGKITRGERGIKDDIANDIIVNLERKAQQLIDAAQKLRNPEKFLIRQGEFSAITFDEEGVRQWDGFQEFPISSIGVVLYNADLGVHESEIAFPSYIIAAAATEALKTGSNHELLKLIPEYFDLQFFNNFDLQEFRID